MSQQQLREPDQMIGLQFALLSTRYPLKDVYVPQTLIPMPSLRLQSALDLVHVAVAREINLIVEVDGEKISAEEAICLAARAAYAKYVDIMAWSGGDRRLADLEAVRSMLEIALERLQHPKVTDSRFADSVGEKLGLLEQIAEKGLMEFAE